MGDLIYAVALIFVGIAAACLTIALGGDSLRGFYRMVRGGVWY